jgi:hypothetical protein
MSFTRQNGTSKLDAYSRRSRRTKTAQVILALERFLDAEQPAHAEENPKRKKGGK